MMLIMPTRTVGKPVFATVRESATTGASSRGSDPGSSLPPQRTHCPYAAHLT